MNFASTLSIAKFFVSISARTPASINNVTTLEKIKRVGDLYQPLYK
jgi:hypothetical protein